MGKLRQWPSGLATFRAPVDVRSVELDCGIHTVICPFRGTRDIVRVTIRYAPTGRCLETQSVWNYLCAKEDDRVGHEELASVISADVRQAIGTTPDVEVQYLYRGINVRVNGR